MSLKKPEVNVKVYVSIWCEMEETPSNIFHGHRNMFFKPNISVQEAVKSIQKLKSKSVSMAGKMKLRKSGECIFSPQGCCSFNYSGAGLRTVSD